MLILADALVQLSRQAASGAPGDNSYCVSGWMIEQMRSPVKALCAVNWLRVWWKLHTAWQTLASSASLAD